MAKIRIFFTADPEHFVRGIVTGTIINERVKGPGAIAIFRERQQRVPVEFKAENFAPGIRTALVEAGKLTEFHESFLVANIKKWARRGQKKVFLAAEQLPNEKKGLQGILFTPFKLGQLAKAGKTPRTIRTGQERFEVNPRENIVAASFAAFARKPVGNVPLSLVATPEIEPLIRAPRLIKLRRVPPVVLEKGTKLFQLVHEELARRKKGFVGTVGHEVSPGAWVPHTVKKIGPGKYALVSRRRRPR